MSTKQELVVQREFMAALRLTVLECFQKGLSEEEARRTVHLKEYESWLGLQRLPLCVSRIYLELRGEIR